MTDVLTRRQRSSCMAAIRARDTKPEIIVRKLLRSAGYRFRVNVASLPGKPDLVFPHDKKVIFVHGCFWHRHNCKSGRSEPATRNAFWRRKFAGNKLRDRKRISELRSMGWKALVLWQCQLGRRKANRSLARIRSFLSAT
jgi:DNA mismatch endonuclease (patch repair protein)